MAAILWASAARAGGPPPPQETPAPSKPTPVAWEPNRKNVLGIDALSMIFWPSILRGLMLELPATFEHTFIPYLSGTGTLSLVAVATTPGPTPSYALTLEVSAGARYYLAGDAPRGFWVGSRVWYSPRARESAILGLAGSGVRILGECGYQWITESRLVIGASAGWDQIGYAISSDETLPRALSGLRASFIVGWSF